MLYLEFILIAEEQYNMLRSEMVKSKQAVFTESTRKNLKSQWIAYLMFCIYFSLKELPATIDTICMYTQFLSRSLTSVTSIKNYLNAVKLLHIFNNLDYPHTESNELKLLIRGISRLHPHCEKRALPIIPDILLEFVTFLDFQNPIDVTYWCIFLFSFFMMVRKSQLVLNSYGQKQCNKVLKTKDVAVHKYGLIVTIHWTKTIQFGERKLKIPLLAIADSPLEPG